MDSAGPSIDGQANRQLERPGDRPARSRRSVEFLGRWISMCALTPRTVFFERGEGGLAVGCRWS